MAVRMFDPSYQLTFDVYDAMEHVLQRGQYIMGPETEAFEEEFAAYCGSRYCVAVGSGTEAMELVLDCLRPRTTMVPAITWPSTAWSAFKSGSAVKFVDVGKDDCVVPQYDCEHSHDAVMHVHMHGTVTQPILGGCKGTVIEDCAQAGGIKLGGDRIGCFSFYPTKNLGALGDAGAVCLDDVAIASYIRRTRDYGRDQQGRFTNEIGRNCRMGELQAAVLRVKLKKLDKYNAWREQAAVYYNDRLLDHTHLVRVPWMSWGHLWHQYVIRLKTCRPKDVMQYAKEKHSVELGRHYDFVVPSLPPFHQAASKYSNALEWSMTSLSLPIYPGITRDQQDEVVHAVLEAIQRL